MWNRGKNGNHITFPSGVGALPAALAMADVSTSGKNGNRTGYQPSIPASSMVYSDSGKNGNRFPVRAGGLRGRRSSRRGFNRRLISGKIGNRHPTSPSVDLPGLRCLRVEPSFSGRIGNRHADTPISGKNGNRQCGRIGNPYTNTSHSGRIGNRFSRECGHFGKNGNRSRCVSVFLCVLCGESSLFGKNGNRHPRISRGPSAREPQFIASAREPQFTDSAGSHRVGSGRGPSPRGRGGRVPAAAQLALKRRRDGGRGSFTPPARTPDRRSCRPARSPPGRPASGPAPSRRPSGSPS